MNQLVNGCVRGVFILLTAVSLATVQTTASLNGRLTESGGVLPSITVTVIQTDTGFARSVGSGDSGEWLAPNLPTGPYRLEVALFNLLNNFNWATRTPTSARGTPDGSPRARAIPGSCSSA
jgi:hypothetical protein